jgi:hypothetical protein
MIDLFCLQYFFGEKKRFGFKSLKTKTWYFYRFLTVL